MKRVFSHVFLILAAFFMMACESEEVNAMPPTDNSTTMILTVNNHTLKVNLADNAATKALLGRLQDGSITYTANDYGGFEKVGALGFSLPSNDTYITTQPGDIMLYTSNQLCIFLGQNSWEYTRIGKIEGMSSAQLREAFGNGQVSITLSLDNITGMNMVTANKADGKIYSVNGQKLNNAPAKGVYIENGIKKIK